MTKLDKFRNWWRESDIRIFLWAIARSDISECRVVPVLPILKISSWIDGVGDRYLTVQFKMPRITLCLSGRIIDDFAKATGIEPDRYFIPF